MFAWLDATLPTKKPLYHKGLTCRHSDGRSVSRRNAVGAKPYVWTKTADEIAGGLAVALHREHAQSATDGLSARTRADTPGVPPPAPSPGRHDLPTAERDVVPPRSRHATRPTRAGDVASRRPPCSGPPFHCLEHLHLGSEPQTAGRLLDVSRPPPAHGAVPGPRRNAAGVGGATWVCYARRWLVHSTFVIGLCRCPTTGRGTSSRHPPHLSSIPTPPFRTSPEKRPRAQEAQT